MSRFEELTELLSNAYEDMVDAPDEESHDRAYFQAQELEAELDELALETEGYNYV